MTKKPAGQIELTPILVSITGVVGLSTQAMLNRGMVLEAVGTIVIYSCALTAALIISKRISRRKADRAPDVLAEELLRHPLFGMCAAHVRFVIDTFNFSGTKRTWAYRTLLKYKFHFVGQMYQENIERIVLAMKTDEHHPMIEYPARLEHLQTIITAYEQASINAGVPEVVVRVFSDKYHAENVGMIVKAVEDNCRSTLYDDFQRLNAELDIVTVAMRTVIHDIEEMDQANGEVQRALDEMPDRDPVMVEVK